MQMLLTLAVIAVIIFYVLRMKANQKTEDDESAGKGQQGFMKDIFFPSGSASNIDSDNNSSSVDEKDDDDDDDDEEDDDVGTLQIGDPYNDLEKLAALFEKGVLTKDEYEAKKKELLDRI